MYYIGFFLIMFLITVDTVIIITFLSKIEERILLYILEESDDIELTLMTILKKLKRK